MPFDEYGFATGDDIKLPLFICEPTQLSDLVFCYTAPNLQQFLGQIIGEEYRDNLPFYWGDLTHYLTIPPDPRRVTYYQNAYLLQRYNPSGRNFADGYSLKLYEFYKKYIPLYHAYYGGIYIGKPGDTSQKYSFSTSRIGLNFGEREIELPNNGKILRLSYYYAEYQESETELPSVERTNYRHIDNDCIKSPFTRSWLLRFETYLCLGQTIKIKDNILVASLVLEYDETVWGEIQVDLSSENLEYEEADEIREEDKSDITKVIEQIPKYYFYDYIDRFLERIDNLILTNEPQALNVHVATRLRYSSDYKCQVQLRNNVNSRYDRRYDCNILEEPDYNNYFRMGLGYTALDALPTATQPVPDYIKNVRGCLLYANNNYWNNYDFRLEDKGLSCGVTYNFRFTNKTAAFYYHMLSYHASSPRIEQQTNVDLDFFANTDGIRFAGFPQDVEITNGNVYNLYTNREVSVYASTRLNPNALPLTLIDYQSQVNRGFYDGYEFREAWIFPGSHEFTSRWFGEPQVFESGILRDVYLSQTTACILYAFATLNKFHRTLVTVKTAETNSTVRAEKAELEQEFITYKQRLLYTRNYFSGMSIGGFHEVNAANIDSIGSVFNSNKAGELGDNDCKHYYGNNSAVSWYPHIVEYQHYYPDGIILALPNTGAFENRKDQANVGYRSPGLGLATSSPMNEPVFLNADNTKTVTENQDFILRTADTAENELFWFYYYRREPLGGAIEAHNKCTKMAIPDLEELKLQVREIHMSLEAHKFAYLDDTPDVARVANLGYYIERIARVLGISVNSDGSIRSIRSSKAINRDTIPAGWNLGQFGRNQGGNPNPLAQEGGHPKHDKDGIAYEIRSNKFAVNPFNGKPNFIEQGGYALCENLPQMLHIMLDDLDRALGLQSAGANVLPTPDGQGAAYYQGLNNMVLDILYTLSKISQTASSAQITGLRNTAILQEIMASLGLPVAVGEVPITIDRQQYSLPVPIHDRDSPTLSDLMFACLLNLGFVNGVNTQVPIEESETTESQSEVENQDSTPFDGDNTN